MATVYNRRPYEVHGLSPCNSVSEVDGATSITGCDFARMPDSHMCLMFTPEQIFECASWIFDHFYFHNFAHRLKASRIAKKSGRPLTAAD